jgi:hypothetical protein
VNARLTVAAIKIVKQQEEQGMLMQGENTLDIILVELPQYLTVTRGRAMP